MVKIRLLREKIGEMITPVTPGAVPAATEGDGSPVLKSEGGPGRPLRLFQALQTGVRRLRPALRVLIVGLVVIGVVAMGQYIGGPRGTTVRVLTKGAEPAAPALLREPVNVPQGSPSAPAAEQEEATARPAAPLPAATLEPGTPNWGQSRPPIQGKVVTAFGFGYAEFFDDYRLQSGVEYTAPQGTPIVAVLNGSVAAIEDDPLYGIAVTVDHGDGWQSVYAPVAAATVVPGQWVDGGDQLGRLDVSPPVANHHGTRLHFSLLQHGEPADPALYLR